MLKKWYEQASQPEPAVVGKQDLLVRAVHMEEELEEKYLPVHQDEGCLDLQHLTEEQRGQLLESIPHQLFLNSPGTTDLVHHRIYLKENKPIHQYPYKVPQKLLPLLKEGI